MLRLDFKVGDIVVIIIFISIVLLSVSLSTGASGAPLVQIESVDSTFLYPMDTDLKLAVSGPQGNCDVVISENTLTIVDSDCPDKICQAMTPINRIGEWTACLPNRVMIRITGGDSDMPTDAVTF